MTIVILVHNFHMSALTFAFDLNIAVTVSVSMILSSSFSRHLSIGSVHCSCMYLVKLAVLFADHIEWLKTHGRE